MPAPLLLTGATASLLLLLAWGGTEFPWLSADSAGLVVLTLALAGLFILQELRAKEPLIRLPLFRNPVFARGVAVGGMMSFAMLGSTVFLPLYFQLVLGMDPAVAGMMLLPQVLGMLLTSIIGGRIVTRLGRNKPFLLSGPGAGGGCPGQPGRLRLASARRPPPSSSPWARSAWAWAWACRT